MTGLAWTGLVLGVLVMAAAGLSALGRHRWAGTTRRLVARLEAGRIGARGLSTPTPTPSPPLRYDARELLGLPAPVQRYFRAVLQDGQPIITAVTIDLAGRFNLSPTGAQWKPFTAHQRITTRRPGFVWDARIAVLPGVAVHVVDSYIAGHGLLQAAAQGLWTVADLRGEGEIARGEFMRWFAEVAWYPTALLPSQGVRWQAVDAHAALATVVDGPRSLCLLFRFNEAGLLSGFRAEARGAMQGRQMVMAPWEGSWSNYQPCNGMQLPFTGEVAWMRPDGRRPYFVGSVTALAVEFAP